MNTTSSIQLTQRTPSISGLTSLETASQPLSHQTVFEAQRRNQIHSGKRPTQNSFSYTSKSYENLPDHYYQNPASRRIPWKSIFLALILFLGGSIGIIIGILMTTCHIGSCGPNTDGSIPVFILSALMFLPGSYHTYIAWNVWRGTPGYTWSQIPTVQH